MHLFHRCPMTKKLEPACALIASDHDWNGKKTIILEFKKYGKANITIFDLHLFLTVLPQKDVDS